jgi:hypothetical protein
MSVIKAEFPGRGRLEVEKNYKHKAAEFPLAEQFLSCHKLRIALSQLNNRNGLVSALEKALRGQTRIFGFLSSPQFNGKYSQPHPDCACFFFRSKLPTPRRTEP